MLRKMKPTWFLRASFGLAAILLVFAGAAAAQPNTAPGRVAAVGDIHGDLQNLTVILKQARLVDAAGRWAGKNATFIQVGDAIDRGPAMRGVLDLLMALEKQAPKKGGRAIAVLGNHEVMNIIGDLRYVTPENYASFADKDSEKRRQAAWQSYVEWRKQRALALGQPGPEMTPEAQKEWMDKHPLGFVEHRTAFGPTGQYGKWLRERPTLVQVNGVLFVHGGLGPELVSLKLDAVNQRVRDDLKAYDSYMQFFLQERLALPFFTIEEIITAVHQEVQARQDELAQKSAQAKEEGKTYQPTEEEKKRNTFLAEFLGFPGWFSQHQSGPLWFRSYTAWSDEEGALQMDKLLAAFGATAIVCGHTPQRDGRIRARFGGRAYLIDTGMLTAHYPGGRAAALEIDKGKFTAIYTDQNVLLFDRSATTAGERPAKQEKPEEPSGDFGGGSAARSAGQQAPPPQSPPRQEEEPPRVSKLPARVFLGPDGKPLPFKSDEEIMEFMRTARVVSKKDIGEGINHPREFLLEKDGIQMHAVFRDVNIDKDIADLAGGRRELFFRDSYIFECAAYELSKMLGLDNVPPVVQRTVDGTKGSLQIWIENAFSETKRQKRKIRPPDVYLWNRQVQVMRMWDNLVFNTDRNMGNVLIDPNWKLWMIDHTRAFRRYSDLRDPKTIVLCERGMWERLQSFNTETFKERMKPLLRPYEISSILDRRAKLIQYIQKMIQEKGEDKVLFSWQAP